MKSSKQSIFKRIQTKFHSLPDIQQTVLCGAIAVILVFSTVAFQHFYPDTSTAPTKPYYFNSEQETNLQKTTRIKEIMDEHVIGQTEKLSQMVDNIKDEHKDLIGKNFVTDFKASKFRSLSIAYDTYSKELCESYNSVSFCAELKAEFVSNINMKADSQIKAANNEREEALSKLEN